MGNGNGNGVRLAIVGSVRFADLAGWAQARAKARAAIVWLDPEVVISGGAIGVDSLVRRVAAELGYTVDNGRFVEHRPAVHAWAAPGGLRDRNLRIAADCTHLLALRCRRAGSYGSFWTADRAAELGRVVWRRTLPELS